MADAPVVHIGENSPEQIAFRLLEMVARVELKSTSALQQSELKAPWTKADRKWILDTYAECIDAVAAQRTYARDI